MTDDEKAAAVFHAMVRWPWIVQHYGHEWHRSYTFYDIYTTRAEAEQLILKLIIREHHKDFRVAQLATTYKER